jgi:hypothetical protein
MIHVLFAAGQLLGFSAMLDLMFRLMDEMNFFICRVYGIRRGWQFEFYEGIRRGQQLEFCLLI